MSFSLLRTRTLVVQSGPAIRHDSSPRSQAKPTLAGAISNPGSMYEIEAVEKSVAMTPSGQRETRKVCIWDVLPTVFWASVTESSVALPPA
jgi:hypothetical protein